MQRNLILLVDTFIIGIVGAVCSELFILLLDVISKFSLGYIAGYIPPDTLELLKPYITHAYNPMYLIGVIVVGGLVSGFLVYTFAPEAEGHGTDTVVRAFHRTGGYLRPIVTPIKLLASAITIGTGGSAGREGPTALFSSGIGSMYASIRKVTTEKRELFVLLGMASGLSAVFKAPMGTAIFSIEVLYSDTEFETQELMFVLFGPLIAYTITGYLFGWQPIFTIPKNLEVTHIITFVEIILLGVASGLVSSFLPTVFYRTRDLFRKLPIKPHFKPALGALFVGLMAIYFPQVLGGGYGWIQEAISGSMMAKLLIILLFAKIFAFSFTVGSGGSGGVFAPTLFIGSMLGGAFASYFHQPSAIFVVIAMAAVFGAAARTPLAAIVIVIEMAGGYSLLVPTILAVFFSHMTHMLLSEKLNLKYTSLYEAQLINKNYSPIYQIKKLRNILFCYGDLLKLSPKMIKNEKMLSLLESGVPIKLPNRKNLFFGEFKKNVKLEEEGSVKQYKNIRILYVFRNGMWYHPTEIHSIRKSDEILIYGSKTAVADAKKDFIPISYTFSKLKVQHEKLEEDVDETIPIK